MSESKQAEKDYLRRTAAGAWELVKPFSPAGASTIEESAALIQDFAAAIRHLPPAPTDLILDLGAGSCWCSDWLQRLNLRTVAVDIAWDMLRLGRDRLPRREAAWLVAGDLEHLPFAAGSFDKAYCLSVIHHVPDIGRAVAEIHRVLTPAGAVLFSEPGLGHADTPGSIAAMRDFGVLEQDIVAGDFMERCRQAGFADVWLKPLSYLVPDLGLTAEEWRQWQQLAHSRRPGRAARKMWRAWLELIGRGKRDALFEETFAMTTVRLLRGAMEDHPVIVAAKGPLGTTVAADDRAEVTIAGAPAHVDAGAPIPLRVVVANRGAARWRIGSGAGQVRLGVQLLDAGHRLVNRDFHREELPAPVPPGAHGECAFTCPAPQRPGVYHLRVDLVREGVRWFDAGRSAGAVCRIEVV